MGIEPTSSALVTIVGLKPTFHFCVFYYTKPWEGRGNSHYTIPAFYYFLSFLTYILYTKFQEKSNFMEGSN